jgi:hypothetical protein
VSVLTNAFSQDRASRVTRLNPSHREPEATIAADRIASISCGSGNVKVPVRAVLCQEGEGLDEYVESLLLGEASDAEHYGPLVHFRTRREELMVHTVVDDVDVTPDLKAGTTHQCPEIR